jgi:hypothetical protein
LAFSWLFNRIIVAFTALPGVGVMRYKNTTPNPLIACGEGAKMYLIYLQYAIRFFVWIISSFA